jgi:hypothetical protein
MACITQVFLAYRWVAASSSEVPVAYSFFPGILRLEKIITLYTTVLVLAAAAFFFVIFFGVKVCNFKTYAILSQRLSLIFGADFLMTSLIERTGLSPLISVWLCLKVLVKVLITGLCLRLIRSTCSVTPISQVSYCIHFPHHEWDFRYLIV